MPFNVKDWRDALTYAGGGDTSTPLSSTAIEDMERRLSDYTDDSLPFVDVKVHGNAVGGGAGDDTAEIQAAIDSCGGKGTVYIPPDTFNFSGRLSVPGNVNLVGAGGAASGITGIGTVLRATNANAQLMFGDGTAPNSVGGLSGGFVLDGNATSNRAGGLLYDNFNVQRSFRDIYVLNTLGDGIVIEQSQNNLWEQINVQYVAGDAVILDRGTGGSTFKRLGTYGASGYHLHIRATALGPYNEARSNFFEGSIFEGIGTTVGGGVVGVGDGIINLAAGIGNNFTNCVTSGYGATQEFSHIDARETVGYYTQFNRFTDCTFAGDPSHGTALRGHGNTSTWFGGRCQFELMPRAFYLTDTDVVEIDQDVNRNSVPTFFANNGGTLPQQALIRRRNDGIRHVWVSQSAIDNIFADLYRTGENYPRVEILDNQIAFGDGTSTPIANIFYGGTTSRRVGMGELLVNSKLLLSQDGYIDGVEIADPGGSGANIGRLYFRDNGSGKTQLCVQFPTGSPQVIATQP